MNYTFACMYTNVYHTERNMKRIVIFIYFSVIKHSILTMPYAAGFLFYQKKLFFFNFYLRSKLDCMYRMLNTFFPLTKRILYNVDTIQHVFNATYRLAYLNFFLNCKNFQKIFLSSEAY